MYKHIFFVTSAVFLFVYVIGAIEYPCKSRPIVGNSVVCVCDAEYCDEIVREKPTNEHHVAYTTSKEGLRFDKSKGILQEAIDGTYSLTTLELNVSKLYQTVDGFGGAITDATAANWMSLKDPRLRDYLINSYFSETGLQYNVIRTPIGSCDSSLRKYALNELPLYDKHLKNFSLAHEDYNLKIPMFKAAMSASRDDIYVIATTWSPPDWMKIPNEISVCGKLNPDFYQTYADYHIKFIDAYTKNGIKIWAITTTNEPTNSFLSTSVFNCMGWTSSDQGKWIMRNLGPTVRRSKYNNTMIFVNDDQRYSIPFLFNGLLSSTPGVMKYIDGVAVHGYADFLVSPSTLSAVSKPYPHMKLMATEFCTGIFSPKNVKVDLGSWTSAEAYLESILENLNYGAVGYLDWNLCLDKRGGPNWSLNFLDSPIIVFPDKGEFVKQPSFYAMGHFAKFIPRGSKRVDVKIKKADGDLKLKNVAFLTPENTTVVILFNPSEATTVSIKLGSKSTVVLLPASSVVTVEILVDDSSYQPSRENTGPGGPPEKPNAAIAPEAVSQPPPTDKTTDQPSNSTTSSPTKNSKPKPTKMGHMMNNTQKQTKPASQLPPRRPPANRPPPRRPPPRRPHPGTIRRGVRF